VTIALVHHRDPQKFCWSGSVKLL